MRVRPQDKAECRFHSRPSRSSHHDQKCAGFSQHKIKIRMLIISVHRLRVS
jgi:hypothetical protein